MLILDLPAEVLEIILNNLSYDEVSHCRLVCQRFNEISKKVLNHGFLSVKKFNMHCLKSVKSQLPRRESQRRCHRLSSHFYIFTIIEERLFLLSCTFQKYIESNKCCFIFGKVLDEVFRVIRYVNSVQTASDPLDTYDILQEMRDLSSMAREYFKEKIAPGLNKKLKEKRFTSMKHLRPNAPPSQLYKSPSFLNELSKKYSSAMSGLTTSLKIKQKELKKVGKRITDLEQFAADCKKKISETEKIIADQQAAISRQEKKLFDQELKIKNLTKLVEEMTEVGREGTACKSWTADTRRGQNGGRETVIMTRATKRKLGQNLNDMTGTRGRKRSRRCLNS